MANGGGRFAAFASGDPPDGRIVIGPSVTDDVNRYKHDGTQPMRDRATPSHKKDVEWTIKH